MTGRSSVGGNRPEISASRRASSSSRPRLPGGLVSRSRARWASRPGAGSGIPMLLRSFWRTGIRGDPWRAVFDEHGNAGNHEGDAIGRHREAPVDAAERVLEAYPYLGRRVDAGADLVGHDDDRGASLDHELRQLFRGRQHVVREVTTKQEVRHPEGEAIEDDEIDAIGQSPAGLDDLVGLLHRAPTLGPVGLVPRDAPGHVAIVGPRGGEKARAPARMGSGGEQDGLAALADTDTAENQVRSMKLGLTGRAHPGPPAKTGWRVSAWAGLLAFGSSYSPRLPGPAPLGPVASRGFRPRLQ